ncbi:aldo/keto reductase [Devosia sp.]|uniref:aldo/keto reductase n=1 Tax=Devosia sp. TaxID=1871048 RepID=UPI001ACC44E2|nr:aldo/keto reductase [Devosia sp.]MBN9309557.1 aldo/keto reductase [Devosia sp.]
MAKRRLGRSQLFIDPIVLGTNVIGAGVDEKTSFDVLDAFTAEGFTAIDTADSYSRWIPGNDSESEKVIGRWIKARGNRDKVLVFTKVGSDMGQGHRDLSARWIMEEVEHSLKRLQTDYIDLYQSHWPDPNTPQEETLEAHDRLVKAGKVRFIGTSNHDVSLLSEALEISRRRGFARYDTIQNEFNLYSRGKFSGALQELCVKEEVSGIHYFGLARGFLTGKYRKPEDAAKSHRGKGVVDNYFNDKGFRILAALDKVSARTGAAPTEIALAWVAAQPGVAAPIASATSVEQVKSLARGARLTLSAEDLKELTDAGN